MRRKLARDLRVAMPGLLLVMSAVVTAFVIDAAEAIPMRAAQAHRAQRAVAPVSTAAEDMAEAVGATAEIGCARPPTSRLCPGSEISAASESTCHTRTRPSAPPVATSTVWSNDTFT